MARLPKEANVPIDMKVTLGAKAKKPLQIDIPLMISGWVLEWVSAKRLKEP